MRRALIVVGLAGLLAACATPTRIISPDERARIDAAAQACLREYPSVERYEVDQFGQVTAMHRGPSRAASADPFFACVRAQLPPRSPAAAAASSPAALSLPLPTDLRLVRPGPEIPPAWAAFAGRWQGRWDERPTAPTILVVEELTPADAIVVVANQGTKGPLWFRRRATAVNGALSFQSGPVMFVYRVQPDGSLFGTMEDQGRIFRARLMRVSEP